ncbi:MAG: uncharacterized protein PWP24_1587 [Clostridiales bacterium]|nr:uncharacterized protein [Clostridiales bacterium]
MKPSTQLYRRRYVPNELIHLKDDCIVKQTDSLIVTKWNTLKPRTDFSHGMSAYFIKDGYKVSKIYNHEHKLVYWYCDIIETEYRADDHSYIFHDLLVDILVMPDGSIQVVDLDELGDLLMSEIISPLLCAKALKIANSLLNIIYHNAFYELQQVIEELES